MREATTDQLSGGMPLIGISGQRRLGAEVGRLPNFVAGMPIDVYISSYARSVTEAGGIPVLLTRDADPQATVERLDGLILSGGEDVDPRRYGSTPSSGATVLDPGRDEFEFALLDAAVERGIPILGICRGCQLINVAMGGTLVSDLAVGEGESHAFYGYPATHRSHEVDILEGSTLHNVFGRSLRVNSYHHQAVKDPGLGVTVTARAADGVIEGIELSDKRITAVQWHPEMFGGDPIFSWLTAEARAPRGVLSSTLGQ